MLDSYGTAIETRTRDIAASLSIPEFVYRVPLVAKGSAVREIGDGILSCGAGGAILQVKARLLGHGLRDSQQDAERWVLKHVARAVRQGRGSRRTIISFNNSGNPLAAVPARPIVVGEAMSINVRLDGECGNWPIIVVINHPKNPCITLPYYDDVFCISYDDWLELNRHIRSVHRLLRYIHLALGSGIRASVPLGRESDRFESLAKHEAHQFRTPITETSYAADHDPGAIAVYRQLLERTWGPNDIMPLVAAEDYRPVLDYLDDAPASIQSYVGNWILNRHDHLRFTGELSSGAVLLVDRPLIYMCSYADSWQDKEAWLGNLLGLTSVRATEWRSQIGGQRPVLGIGVRIMGSVREYSYALVKSGSLPRDVSRTLKWKFGSANFKTFRVQPLAIGRNERCPCGSGSKYKRCHVSNKDSD